MTDIGVCVDYAERMRHGIIAAAERKKKGADGYELYRWLSIPLELTKEHGARLVPCLLFLVEETCFVPSDTMLPIISLLKGIMFFDEDSLDAFLEIEEIRLVTPTRSALRELGVQIASAINQPDKELMGATFDWLHATAN